MKDITPAKLLWVGRTALHWDQDYEDIRALHEGLSFRIDMDVLVRCVVSRIIEDADYLFPHFVVNLPVMVLPGL